MGLLATKWWWAAGVAFCLGVIAACAVVIERQNARVYAQHCAFADCERVKNGVRIEPENWKLP
jgi:hypothetical protein